EGKTSQLPMAIEGGRRYGMTPLNDALVGLVQQGVVDGREAYRYASDRPGLLAVLKRQGVDTSFVEKLASNPPSSGRIQRATNGWISFTRNVSRSSSVMDSGSPDATIRSASTTWRPRLRITRATTRGASDVVSSAISM